MKFFFALSLFTSLASAGAYQFVYMIDGELSGDGVLSGSAPSTQTINSSVQGGFGVQFGPSSKVFLNGTVTQSPNGKGVLRGKVTLADGEMQFDHGWYGATREVQGGVHFVDFAGQITGGTGSYRGCVGFLSAVGEGGIIDNENGYGFRVALSAICLAPQSH